MSIRTLKVTLLVFVAVAGTTSAEWRVRKLGRWGGPVNGVAVDGQHIYMGSGTRLIVLDHAQGGNPIKVGSIDFDATVTAVLYDDGLLYVSTMPGPTVRVVDVSDPGHPVEVGSNDEIEYDFGALAIYGSALFAGGDDGSPDGLSVYDVSDPAAPFLVLEQWDPVQEGWWFLTDIAIEGHYLYAADEDEEFHVVDISDPFDPQHRATVTGIDTPIGLDVEGDRLYVTTNLTFPAGFVIYDVSDPANPVELGTFLRVGRSAVDVSVEGDVAFVAWAEDGLVVVDVSDPANPVQRAIVEEARSARHVTAIGSKAYVGDLGEGLLIVDAANPNSPQIAGNFDSPGLLTRLTLDGDRLYACDNYVGFTTVDVSDPRDMRTAGQYVSAGGYNEYGIVWEGAWEMQARDGFAYVSSGPNGFEIVDLSDETNPVKISGIDTTTAAWAFDIEGDRAYVAHNLDAFKIINISDPYNPFVISTPPAAQSPRSVLVEDSVYYAGMSNLLQTQSFPGPPLWYGQPGVTDMAKSGDILYVASANTGEYGLHTLDVTDPANLVALDTFTTSGANGVALSGDYLYLGSDPLYLMDVSDPSSLSPVMSTTDVIGASLVLDGHFLYGVRDGVWSALTYQPGDLDLDEDVDLLDYQRLQQCYGGPDVAPADAECLVFDIDEDDDVDTTDLTLFQTYYTGPQ